MSNFGTEFEAGKQQAFKEVEKDIDKIKQNLIINEDFKYRSARIFIDMLEELKQKIKEKLK